MKSDNIIQYKYVVALIGSTGLTAFLNFLVQIYIARNSSIYVFGVFSTYNTLMLMVMPLVTLGLGHLLLKKISEKNSGNEKIDINILILLLISSGLGLFLLNLVLTYYYPNFNEIIVFSLSLGALGYAYHELIQFYFIGLNKRKNLIIWQPYLNGIRLLFVVFIIFLFKEFTLTGLALFSFMFSISIFVTIYIMKENLFDLRVAYFSKNIIKNNIKEGVWFALVGFLYILYSQINILYIGKYLNSELAGFFNIGYTFVLLSLIIPNTIYYKFLLPKLHFLAKNNPDKLKKIYFQGGVLSILSGSFICLILYLFSEIIIRLFYGEKFLGANSIFENIIFSIPFFYLSIHLGVFSYLGSAQKFKVLVLSIVTLFSLIMNYIMIVKFGLEGATFGLIMVVCLMVILYAVINHYFVFKKLVKGVE